MGAILVQVRNLPSAITRYLSPVEILLEDMVKKNVGKRVTVKVLHKDILKGQAGNACTCPIALATIRALTLNKAWYLHVGRGAVTVDSGCRIFRAYLPHKARRFITRIDHEQGKNAEPFTMYLTFKPHGGTI